MPRLIDADALPVTTLTDGGYWTKDVVYKQDIDAAPTIDPESLRQHGRWIKAAAYNAGKINAVYCSKCKLYQAAGLWDLYPYCPYCGAKMDEEEV